MSRVKKDSLRVCPLGAVDRVLVVQSVLNAQEPPGAMVRYDGRLYYPLSLRSHYKAFVSPSLLKPPRRPLGPLTQRIGCPRGGLIGMT
jgi:hypothetical protein